MLARTTHTYHGALIHGDGVTTIGDMCVSSHRNFFQRHYLFPPSHNIYIHINLMALAVKCNRMRIGWQQQIVSWYVRERVFVCVCLRFKPTSNIKNMRRSASQIPNALKSGSQTSICRFLPHGSNVFLCVFPLGHLKVQ